MYDPNLIYDVGLHLGEDTEYYLKKGFRVIAFEANPELVDIPIRLEQVAQPSGETAGLGWHRLAWCLW